MRILLFSAFAFSLAAATATAQLAPTANDEPAAEPPARNQADRPKPLVPPGGPAAPMRNAMFEAIDADGDGVITARELRRAVVQLRKLDADEDGKITLAEVTPPGAGGPPAPPFGDVAQMVDRLMLNDANGDGKLAINELPPQVAQQMQQMLRGADQDGDGALSKQELLAAMQGMQQRFPGGPAGLQGGPNQFQGGPANLPGGRDAAGGPQRELMGRVWQQFDRNGDNRLDADEVPPQQRGLFRGGDRNGDGVIDAGELRLVIERNGDRMRALRNRGGRDANRNARDEAEDDEAAPDDRGRRE